MKITPEIKEAIRKAAEEAGSQALLAQKIGIASQNICKYIKGQVKAIQPRTWQILLPLLEKHLGDHAQAICAGGSGADLKAGDTVRLRSGGPLMTVVEAGEAVRCAWFQGKENREGSFPAVALDREEPAWHGKE